MKDLLEAFEIFNKYIPDKKYPTHCEHDTLYVLCPPSKLSETDLARVKELGFIPSVNDPSFYSYKYGSA